MSLTTAEELAREIHDLISLPDVYLRLQEVLGRDDWSLDDVARVVSLDPALVARLLRIANSALYNFPSQIETVTRAISMLGTQQIHDLVLATSVARAFKGLPNEVMDMDTFWYRSVLCGFIARTLAEGVELRNAESVFVRGLLHDIGHLVLYNRFPEQCREALRSGRKRFSDIYDAERELIGCNANELGATILSNWGLPEVFVTSFQYLHRPADAPAHGREIALLHIAAWMTHGLDTDLLLCDLIDSTDESTWQMAGIPREVGTVAVDDASLEVVDAMYHVLAVAA